MAKARKISRSADDISELLKDQLDHLTTTCARFDQGDTREYRRIATSIRLLAHQTSRSSSLLGQAGLLSRGFVNSAEHLHPNNIIGECNLIALIVPPHKGPARWVAGLDDGPLEFVKFDIWWNQPVMADQVQPALTRSRLIRHVADQDGGAHVDPEIDEAFERMRRDAFRWTRGKETTEHPDRHAIRQIGHEILKSVRPSYRRRVNRKENIAYCRNWRLVRLGSGPNLEIPKIQSYHWTDPLASCPCGSGRPFRECHSIGSVAPRADQFIDQTFTAPENATYVQLGVQNSYGSARNRDTGSN